MKILRNSLLLVVIAFLAVMMADLYLNFNSRTELNDIAAFYAKKGPSDVGAANLVTSVVVAYRGFDTLGEVTILFLTAAIIGLMLKTEKGTRKEKVRESSEFLHTSSRILIPVIALIGIYIFINGHLTPGGGFQGGAILASTFILILMAFADKKVGHLLLDYTEAISGFALCL
jgi:multicomponent Na+:H+ antiporter subunit B